MDLFPPLFKKKNQEFEESKKQVNLEKARQSWRHINMLFNNKEGKKFLKTTGSIMVLHIHINHVAGTMYINNFSAKPKINKKTSAFNLKMMRQLAALDLTKFNKESRAMLKNSRP